MAPKETKELVSRPAKNCKSHLRLLCFFIYLNSFKMTCKKNERETLNLVVTEGLTVTILPSSDHEFVMPTKEVARGYGVHPTTLRRHFQNHVDELTEGKHYLSNVQILHGASKSGSTRTTMWTKRGIVRLGFFIKSQRARLFRDWAEDLIISLELSQRNLFNEPVPQLKKQTRRHNRLHPARLVSILADVALIDNQLIRERLINKLLMKGNQS